MALSIKRNIHSKRRITFRYVIIVKPLIQMNIVILILIQMTKTKYDEFLKMLKCQKSEDNVNKNKIMEKKNFLKNIKEIDNLRLKD